MYDFFCVYSHPLPHHHHQTHHQTPTPSNCLSQWDMILIIFIDIV